MRISPEKQRQVSEILMMPIVCDKETQVIEIKNGAIHTGQKYRRDADEDMSDFAMGFYEILYPELSPILTEDGWLRNDDFAGDTMNSFQSIANVTKGAGKSEANRTTQDHWPEFLVNYFNHYHCLANFWVLPMKIGRTIVKKLTDFDSMYMFLGFLQPAGWFDAVFYDYPDYRSWAEDYEKFRNLHFIEAYDDDPPLKSCEANAEALVRLAMDRMKARAEAIAASDCAEALWEYFHSLSLIS